MKSIESLHQQALIRWSRLAAQMHPELGLLFAIPNGGLRAKATAARMKAEGVTSGVADLCLPVKRGPNGALWIEMKTRSGRVSPEQREWLRRVGLAGQATAVCYDFDEARQTICDYLGIPCRV